MEGIDLNESTWMLFAEYHLLNSIQGILLWTPLNFSKSSASSRCSPDDIMRLKFSTYMAFWLPADQRRMLKFLSRIFAVRYKPPFTLPALFSHKIRGSTMYYSTFIFIKILFTTFLSLWFGKFIIVIHLNSCPRPNRKDLCQAVQHPEPGLSVRRMADQWKLVCDEFH